MRKSFFIAVVTVVFSMGSVSLRAEDAAPAPVPVPAPGTHMDFRPCPVPSADYEMRRLPESDLVGGLGALREGLNGGFFVLDCGGDPNLHLMHGTLPVAGLSEVGWFRSPARPGFQVVRSIPRDSDEALFWGEGDVLISRGVAAPQHVLRDRFGRPPLDGDEAPAPRRRATAVGNDHYALYAAPAREGSGCVAGQWELNLAHLKARWSDGWSAEGTPVYEPQPTRALGICLAREEWNGSRHFQEAGGWRLTPGIMDFRWEDDDRLTVLIEHLRIDDGGSREALSGISINVADGTATSLYELSGTIGGHRLFPSGCGQYAIAARLAGTTVAILSRRPRALLVEVSDPSNLRASVPFIMSSGMYTCEGGGMSFIAGRPTNDEYSSRSQIIVTVGPWGSSTIHWIEGDTHWTIPAYVPVSGEE